jgi:uncharacterized protein (TIGR02271 family)
MMDRSGITTQPGTNLYDYDVIDSSGGKIGSVDGVWVDDATNRPEFVSVHTGWLFGKSSIIPIENAQVNDASRSIQVPYSSDQVKDGPSYDTNAELSPADEDQIYNYYGLQRSTATSPTGYAAGGTGPTEDATAQVGTLDTAQGTLETGQEEVRVPVSEEELQVGKRQVEAGRVRLRKVVRTEQREVPVELRREEIDIERAPATGAEVPSDAFQEREFEVPITREEPVVGKEAHVTGEVRVGKDVETEQRTVGGEVRREEVELDEEGDVDTGRLPQDRLP